MKNIHLPTWELITPQEVEIHYKRPLFQSMLYVKSSINADKYFRKFINLKKIDFKEFFWVMLLNSTRRVLAFSEINSGKDDLVIVNIKEILQLALLTNASFVIIFHNHPSGVLKISESDNKLTIAVKEALTNIGLSLLDHIIITSEGYISFADESKL